MNGYVTSATTAETTTGRCHVVLPVPCSQLTDTQQQDHQETISGGTPVDSLLVEFLDVTSPAGVQCEVRHATSNPDYSRPTGDCRPRRLAPNRLAIAKAKFDAMLRDGPASPSESSWASTLCIVSKEDKGWSPCCDYRALNAYHCSATICMTSKQ
jgi:hypothetical protein